MKLPDWFPECSRPLSPEKARVWDLMTSQERKRSFLFDCILFLGAFALIGLSGR